jgi:hypothetical protein
MLRRDGAGRWLVKSASNPNEYWIDEQDCCMVEAIKAADSSGLPSDKECLARTPVEKCRSGLESRATFRLVGVAAGTALAIDGIRRIMDGDRKGEAEFAIGVAIDLLSIFA